jgi:hypothetical protein
MYRQLFSPASTVQGGTKDEAYKSPKYQSQCRAAQHISNHQANYRAEDNPKRGFDNSSGFGVLSLI